MSLQQDIANLRVQTKALGQRGFNKQALFAEALDPAVIHQIGAALAHAGHGVNQARDAANNFLLDASTTAINWPLHLAEKAAQHWKGFLTLSALGEGAMFGGRKLAKRLSPSLAQAGAELSAQGKRIHPMIEDHVRMMGGKGGLSDYKQAQALVRQMKTQGASEEEIVNALQQIGRRTPSAGSEEILKLPGERGALLPPGSNYPLAAGHVPEELHGAPFEPSLGAVSSKAEEGKRPQGVLNRLLVRSGVDENVPRNKWHDLAQLPVAATAPITDVRLPYRAVRNTVESRRAQSPAFDRAVRTVAYGAQKVTDAIDAVPSPIQGAGIGLRHWAKKLDDVYFD